MVEKISVLFGVSYKVAFFLLIFVIVWSMSWKLLALWKAARKNSLVWFVVLGIVNTLGILEIVYLFIISEIKKKKNLKVLKRRGKR